MVAIFSRCCFLYFNTEDSENIRFSCNYSAGRSDLVSKSSCFCLIRCQVRVLLLRWSLFLLHTHRADSLWEFSSFIFGFKTSQYKTKVGNLVKDDSGFMIVHPDVITRNLPKNVPTLNRHTADIRYSSFKKYKKKKKQLTSVVSNPPHKPTNDTKPNTNEPG